MTLRPLVAATALGLALALAAPALSPPAFAQAGAAADQNALKSIALNDAQVKSYIGAQPELDAIVTKLTPEQADSPDKKTLAMLDAAAKKHGFASFDEYNTVAGNISAVLDGVDPATKKYVGAEAMLKRQIADLQNDKSVSPADKKSALAEMTAELKEVQPLKFPDNVKVVLANIDALLAAMPKEESPQ